MREREKEREREHLAQDLVWRINASLKLLIRQAFKHSPFLLVPLLSEEAARGGGGEQGDLGSTLLLLTTQSHPRKRYLT